jgi:hypothetical protein
VQQADSLTLFLSLLDDRFQATYHISLLSRLSLAARRVRRMPVPAKRAYRPLGAPMELAAALSAGGTESAPRRSVRLFRACRPAKPCVPTR